MTLRQDVNSDNNDNDDNDNDNDNDDVTLKVVKVS